MVRIIEGGDTIEEREERKLGDNIAEQFNLLGFKGTEEKSLRWYFSSGRVPHVNTSVYDVKKATPNSHGGHEIKWESAEETARNIIVALEVMGIAESNRIQSFHQVPDYQQINGQNSFWDIAIPLIAIDLKKLATWQTGAKLAQDERMRINARSFG